MRVGFVGAGQHATNALYPAALQAGFDVVAVCAQREERARLTAKRWGAQRSYTDLNEMLGEGDLDAVLVAVPAGAYQPILATCIEARLPAFCEKPGGNSASEIRSLAELADEANTEVVVGYMKRFAPSYRRAHELVRQSSFGAPSLAHFTFAIGQVESFLTDPHHYILDNPVHMIDLARYLVGELRDIRTVVNLAPNFGLSISAVALADSGATCSFDFCTTADWAHQGEYIEV